MSKSIVTFLTVMTLIATAPRSGAADARVHQVFGGGTVEYGGSLNVHTFTAKIDDEGNVEGHAEFQLRNLGLDIEVEVECLSVVENNAWLSGTIRTSNDPSLIGQPVLFRVQDNDGVTEDEVGEADRQNGDGSGEPDATEVDMASQVVIGRRAVECDTAPSLGLISWTSGSVKVR